jgi:hypothetical protein
MADRLAPLGATHDWPGYDTRPDLRLVWARSQALQLSLYSCIKIAVPGRVWHVCSNCAVPAAGGLGSLVSEILHAYMQGVWAGWKQNTNF